MATRTFEYCSLHYLNQWLSNDRRYCQGLSNEDKKIKLDVLKEAGGFYRIARNLPTKFDEDKGLKRYSPVLDILDEVERHRFQDNPVKEILNIEKKISKLYGNRSLLSLTTKILWLKIQQPILIYDSQARMALETENGDLATYYEKWHGKFWTFQNDIKKACAKLPNLHLYTLDQNIGTKKYIQEISSQSWFHERVLDIYLWSSGNNA